MKCQAIHKSTHIRAYMPQRINGGRGIPIFSTQVCCRFGTYNLWANEALFSSSSFSFHPTRWRRPSIQFLPLLFLLIRNTILSVLCLLPTGIGYPVHGSAGFFVFSWHIEYYSPLFFSVKAKNSLTHTFFLL
jgi:hypothetical protein